MVPSVDIWCPCSTKQGGGFSHLLTVMAHITLDTGKAALLRDLKMQWLEKDSLLLFHPMVQASNPGLT